MSVNQDDIDKTLKDCNPEVPAPAFKEDDLNVCKPTPEQPIPVLPKYDDIEQVLLKAMGIEPPAELTNCVSSLTTGVLTIKSLLEKQAQLIALINFTRENYWATNLISLFYSTKSQVYNHYFKEFLPLAKEKERLEERLRGYNGYSLNDEERRNVQAELDIVESNIQDVKNQDSTLADKNPKVNLDSIKSDIENEIQKWSDLIKITKNIFGKAQNIEFINQTNFTREVMYGQLRVYYTLERGIASESERAKEEYISNRKALLEKFMNESVQPFYINAINKTAQASKNIAIQNIIQLKNWDSYNDTQLKLKDKFELDSLKYKIVKENAEAAWIKLQADLKQIDIDIDRQVSMIQSISCFDTAEEPEETTPPGEDLDNSGKPKAFKIQNPKYPTIITKRYWRKFCNHATVVGLLPIYWATGLLIPSPNGLIPVPFPIVFKPLAVIPTPIGIFVFMIGQRGVLPCPILYFLQPGFESKFQIALRASNLPIFSMTKAPTTKITAIGENLLFTNQIPITSYIPEAKGPGMDVPKLGKIPGGPIGQVVKQILGPVLGKKSKGGDLAKIIKQIPVVYQQDDLPPWERLTLGNVPWKLYLNSWCLQAKINSGYPGFP